MLKSLRACFLLFIVLKINFDVLMGKSSKIEVFRNIFLRFRNRFNDVLECIIGFVEVHVNKRPQIQHIGIGVRDIVCLIKFF